ncbi:D-2-hydroxyacid dehydrogenase [Cardiobacteriaceae bacterium TAE3-ERU3]|nr:D-2-hydroxyacid dehydrogenase [Cardiobacteriaceae bacterium TAE3-ERU3]
MEHTLRLITRNNAAYREVLREHDLPNLTILDEDSTDKASIWLAEPARAAEILADDDTPQWIQSVFAGVEPLIAHDNHDYQLTSLKEVFGPMISEYAFSHLLAIYQQHRGYRGQQAEKQWQRLPYCSLAGKRLLVLGTGNIGCYLAKTGHFFHMQTAGVNRSGEHPTEFDEVYALDALGEALAQADVVICALPATPGTDGLLNGDMLARLKPDAVLINIGRGNIIDEEVLHQWLLAHPDAQAILDVFQTEPLPDTSPLWGCANVTITPHMAGESMPDKVAEQFAANYRRFIAGEPLHGLVDFAAGY